MTTRRILTILPLLLLACAIFNPLPTDPGAAPATATSTPIPTDTPTSTPEPPTATPLPPDASAFPDPNAYQWELVTGSLVLPVDIQNAGDGSGRLFIVERTGTIRIFQNGQLLPTPFLNITDRVFSAASEQGLLGLAFHPRYEENGLFFVNYIDGNENTVIARFRVSSDPNLADPSSEVQVLYVRQPYWNHNGGVLAFGPDGYLYLGLGDGGSGGDPQGNGQSFNTLLGKILRIDADNGDPYTIPPDNPFGSEIWAYGLRNPWRFSFDARTGDLYIGDVGQGEWEEIDVAPAGVGGLNFGWNYREGGHPYEGQPPAGVQLVEPIAEYSHGEGCSVTGGAVYRGTALPAWQGIYLYGDYCSGLIWGLLPADLGQNAQILFDTFFNISTFGQDEAGEIYLANYGGEVYRLTTR